MRRSRYSVHESGSASKNPKDWHAVISDSEVTSVDISLDEKSLVASNTRGIINYWNLESLSETYLNMMYENKTINDLALSSKGKYLALGFDNGSVDILDLATLLLTYLTLRDLNLPVLHIYEMHLELVLLPRYQHYKINQSFL